MQACDMCSGGVNVKKYLFYVGKNTGTTVKNETAKVVTTTSYTVNHNPMAAHICRGCLMRGYAGLLFQSAVLGVVWAIIASWLFVKDGGMLSYAGLFVLGAGAVAVYEGRDMGSQVGIKARSGEYREKGYDSFFTPAKYRSLK